MDDDNAQNRSKRDNATPNELKDALARLESAVEDLAVTAKDEIAGRATTFIDETTEKLERELYTRRERARRKAQEEPVALAEPIRAPGFYRDKAGGKLGGVCAGLARYWDVEAWVVRCIAITGMLFIPGIVLPAYLILWLILSDSETGERRSSGRRRGKRAKRRAALAADLPNRGAPKRAEVSPRMQFKNVQSVLSQAELRLRRMEAHITSGQYELQKELHALDHEPLKPKTV